MQKAIFRGVRAGFSHVVGNSVNRKMDWKRIMKSGDFYAMIVLLNVFDVRMIGSLASERRKNETVIFA